jgi:hypothetical protein
LYGPGTTDVEVKSMVIDSTENILLGGRSFFIQTTEGEGFVMLVDKHGKATFAKTYASSATGGDIIQKVALQGATYTAVGTSLTTDGPSTKFFLLTFNNAGAIAKNFQLGGSGKILDTASITHMYMQSTNAHIIYDTKFAEIVDTDTAAQNFYIDASLGSLNINNIIKVAIHTFNTVYTVFTVTDAKLHIYFVTSAASDSKDVDVGVAVDTSSSLQTADFDDDATPANVWIAVVASGKINAYYYSLPSDNIPLWTHAVEITVDSIPVAMNIMYVTANSFYISAKLTNSKGSLIKVTDANTAVPLINDKTMATSLSGSWFLGEYTDSVIVTVGTKLNAESVANSKTQAIIFKSDNLLGVDTYNCYTLLITDGNTADDLTDPGVTATTSITIFAEQSDAQIDISTGDSSTGLTDSTSFVIRPESTKSSGMADCKLQEPTFGLTPQVKTTGDDDDPDTVKNFITH